MQGKIACRSRSIGVLYGQITAGVTGGAMRAKSWASPLVAAPTAVILAIALVARAAPAVADDFPSRSVTILIPLAAGGAMDIIARAIAPKLSERIGKPVLIE